MISIKVKDVMYIGNENPILKEEDLFRKAIELIDEKKWGCVSIVNDDNILTGIITDGDIRRLILNTKDTLPELFVKSVKNIMKKNPITIKSDMDLKDALKLLEEKKIWVLPVVDNNNHPIGLLHMQTILKTLADLQ